MADEISINFCPLCGDRVSTADNFCVKCNYDLNDYRVAIGKTLTNESMQDFPEESPAKKFAPVAVGIAIIFATGIGLLNLVNTSNETADYASPVTTQAENSMANQDIQDVNSVINQVVQDENSVTVKDVQPTAPLLGEHWIKDVNTDIYLWNPEPQDGESISWNGGFVEYDGHKFADGSGVLTWYRDGQVIQVDEGTFEHGRHHGQFKHTFKSGNVDYSNWNHGEEIPLRSSTDSAEDEARQAFIAYHRAITNRDYGSAYATLAPEQRHYVGDFDSYSAGYSNTLSSEVSNLYPVNVSEDSATFDYRLTARDRTTGNGVKVQIFDGQVTLGKIDGHWYIFSARSHKVDEWNEN